MKTLLPIGHESGEEGRSPDNFVLSMVVWRCMQVDRGKSRSGGKKSLLTAAKSLQSCPTLCDPMTAAHQAPPSLGFSRQEHWSGLPFPSPMH